MKKYFVFILALILCCASSVSAFAQEEEETTLNASQPRLMVTEYNVDGGYITPSQTATLEIKFKNYSKTKALYNIKLSVNDETGEIETEGMPTEYIESIKASGTYTWKISLKALNTAQIGEHKLTVTAEYEDEYFTPYTATDIVGVTVRQSVGLDYDGIILPEKVIQGDTSTMEVSFMNTGKTDLRNVKLTFEIDGLQSGGALFVGEIPAGESASGSANLRVSADKLGETAGTVTLSYEDAFSETYTQTIDVATVIEKKTETTQPEKEEEKKNALWWLFLVIGLAVGGTVGFAVPTAVNNAKKRKEDELRL